MGMGHGARVVWKLALWSHEVFGPIGVWRHAGGMDLIVIHVTCIIAVFVRLLVSMKLADVAYLGAHIKMWTSIL